MLVLMSKLIFKPANYRSMLFVVDSILIMSTSLVRIVAKFIFYFTQIIPFMLDNIYKVIRPHTINVYMKCWTHIMNAFENLIKLNALFDVYQFGVWIWNQNSSGCEDLCFNIKTIVFFFSSEYLGMVLK